MSTTFSFQHKDSWDGCKTRRHEWLAPLQPRNDVMIELSFIE